MFCPFHARVPCVVNNAQLGKARSCFAKHLAFKVIATQVGIGRHVFKALDYLCISHVGFLSVLS
jgi:hypothetical protein